MPAMIIVVIFIVAAWDVTKTAVKGQHADYQASRPAKKQGKSGKPGKGSPAAGPKTAGTKRPSRARHAAGYWTGEAVHGFPVFRSGWWSGWLAHKTARNQQRSIREQARTTHLQGLADHLRVLREQRELQHQAHEEIQRTLDDAPEPARGRRAVREAAGNVVPIRLRDQAEIRETLARSEEAVRVREHADRILGQPQDPPLPSERVGKPQPGPYAPTRRVDGKPETEADKRFFAERESGYMGPLNQDGYRPDMDNPQEREAAGILERMRQRAENQPGPDAADWSPDDPFPEPEPDNWPKGVPHRRNGDAPSPATNGGNAVMTADTNFHTVVNAAKADVGACDQDQATIRGRKDAAYALADQMTAMNVDPAVIDEQMAKAAAYEKAEGALTEAGEHSGNTATLAERYHGQMQEAVDSSPGQVAERQFHEGG